MAGFPVFAGVEAHPHCGTVPGRVVCQSTWQGVEPAFGGQPLNGSQAFAHRAGCRVSILQRSRQVGYPGPVIEGEQIERGEFLVGVFPYLHQAAPPRVLELIRDDLVAHEFDALAQRILKAHAA